METDNEKSDRKTGLMFHGQWPMKPFKNYLRKSVYYRALDKCPAPQVMSRYQKGFDASKLALRGAAVKLQPSDPLVLIFPNLLQRRVWIPIYPKPQMMFSSWQRPVSRCVD